MNWTWPKLSSREASCGSTVNVRFLSGNSHAIAIWLRTPGDAWLGRLLDLPGIRHIAPAGYDLFADLLFAWNRRKGHW